MVLANISICEKKIFEACISIDKKLSVVTCLDKLMLRPIVRV